MRAWDDLSDHESAEAAIVQIELAIDGMYELDFEQTLTNGRAALEVARRLGDSPLIAASAAALALGEASAGHSPAAREHRDEALEHIDRLPDAVLARQLETLYYLGWTENYLERYDHAIAHAQRGIALARTTGEGRLLIPLMLVQGYPFEMQGRVQEAVAMCEGAVEAARLAANPHYLFWTLFELGWAHYYSGHLEAATDACEESLRIGGRLTKGTMPSAGGGPGWALGVCRFEAGDVQALLDTMAELGDSDLDWAIPVEKCFNWEILALADIALGRPDSAAAYAARAEQDGAALDLNLPAAIAARTRAAVALAAGDAGVAVERSRASVAGAAAAGATMQEAFSRALLGRALAAAGERTDGDRGAARGRARARRVRLGAPPRRGPSRAAQAGCPQRAARAGEGG